MPTVLSLNLTTPTPSVYTFHIIPSLVQVQTHQIHNMPTESPEHLAHRRVLLQLERTIDEHQNHTLDKSQLMALKIDFQRMTLDRKDSDHNPSFFAPYSSLPKPDYSIVSQVRSSLEREDTCFTRPADRARQVAGRWSYYIPCEVKCNPGEVSWS